MEYLLYHLSLQRTANFQVWETIRYLLHEGIKTAFACFITLMGRKRMTKIYVFFGIGWKRGNKCRKYGMRIESIVRRGATNTHDFYDFGRLGNWLGYKDCWNRPDTIKAWVLLYHYLNLRLSNTLVEDNDNNRHPHQTFIYNTSLIDMLIYDHLRGVSVVSSLSTKNC